MEEQARQLGPVTKIGVVATVARCVELCSELHRSVDDLTLRLGPIVPEMLGTGPQDEAGEKNKDPELLVIAANVEKSLRDAVRRVRNLGERVAL